MQLQYGTIHEHIYSLISITIYVLRDADAVAAITRLRSLPAPSAASSARFSII